MYYVCMGAAYGFTPGLERVWIALDSEVSLRLKSALPQAGVTATHIKSSIFSVSFSSIFKRCHPQILWEVNFLFVNVVRGEQTGLSAEESDLCESLQISSSSFWIGSILKWCNFDDQSSLSKKNFLKTRSDTLRTFYKSSLISQNVPKLLWLMHLRCLLRVNNSCDLLSQTAHFWFWEATAAYLEGEPGQVGL